MEAIQEPQATIDLEQLFQFVIALRGGDFSMRLPTDGDGRAKEIAINLNRFASQTETLLEEITRISKEITVGNFGGTLAVDMPPGKWREATEAMNAMEWAITGQIRDFVNTTSRLAAGKTDRPVTVKCEGETETLKTNLNLILARMKG